MIELLGLSENPLIAYHLTKENKHFVCFMTIYEHKFKEAIENLSVDDLHKLLPYPDIDQEHYPEYVNESKLYNNLGLCSPT
jgi:hypothetical protein